jgi:hypothetical protein
VPIENTVKMRMRRRAPVNGGIMEEEVRDTLRHAAREPEESAGGLGTEISSLFSKMGLVSDISELRYALRTPTFDQ